MAARLPAVRSGQELAARPEFNTPTNQTGLLFLKYNTDVKVNEFATFCLTN